MKKFILKIIVLFFALFLVDRVAGLILTNWLDNVTTGGLGKDNYICDHCTEDILIFGSSRAEVHYNAKMIEDSTGIPSYNCGASGNGIILSYGRMLMLSERYHPKYIILEITPEYDLIENKNNFKDLGSLKRHYERHGIKKIFEKIDPLEKVKMLSYLYRYNSDFAHNPLRLLKPIHFNKNSFGIQGFRAEHKKFDKMKVKDKKEKEKFRLDDNKQYYLKEFVNITKDYSQVVFIVSPYWQGRNPEIFNSARHLANSCNIPFLDYSNNPKYLYHDEYFKDGIHLNYIGADEFTRDIIKELRILFRK